MAERDVSKIFTRKFQEQFVRDCTRLAYETPIVELELPFETACSMIAVFQLALRHPGMPPETGRVMRNVAEALIALVARTETVREGLEAGWDASLDVPITEPPY